MFTANPLVEGVFYALCKRVDTPVSLAMWLRFKYGENHQLVTKTIDPEDYTQSQSFKFRSDYLVVSYLSKYPHLKTGVDLEKVAITAFQNAETTCHETNTRLRSPSSFNEGAEAVIFLAQRKIATLLGVYNNSWTSLCKWGPGVTSTLSGGVNFGNKLCEERLSITQAAVPYFRASMATDLHWFRARGINAEGPASLLPAEFQLVKASKLITVPKNAKSDRTIGIEPTCNQFLQGGIGLFIREKLRRVGIHLEDQGVNQNAAKRGLIDNLATIDLSAASDSISSELVAQLLPLEWWRAMDDLRTHRVTVGEESVHLAKFSAMGNGFTFELETLIFWALTQAVTDLSAEEHRVVVYGDDIICHVNIVPKLIRVFRHVGFKINEKKSHWNSLFRESCGEHFFDGINCTPVFLTQEPDKKHQQMIVHNQLMRYAISHGATGMCDSIVKGAFQFLKRSINTHPPIPLLAEGDEGFLTCKHDDLPIGPHGRRLSVLRGVARKTDVSCAAIAAYWFRFGNIGLDPDIFSRKRLSSEAFCKGGTTSVRDSNVYLRRKRRFFPWEREEIRWEG